MKLIAIVETPSDIDSIMDTFRRGTFVMKHIAEMQIVYSVSVLAYVTGSKEMEKWANSTSKE